MKVRIDGWPYSLAFGLSKNPPVDPSAFDCFLGILRWSPIWILLILPSFLIVGVLLFWGNWVKPWLIERRSGESPDRTACVGSETETTD